MIILSRSPKNDGIYSSQQYEPPVTKNNDQGMKLLGISSCKLKAADIVTIAHGCWSLEAKFILRFVQLIDKNPVYVAKQPGKLRCPICLEEIKKETLLYVYEALALV